MQCWCHFKKVKHWKYAFEPSWRACLLFSLHFPHVLPNTQGMWCTGVEAQPLPGEDPGQGTGGAALAWGWGEDCELLRHSLLPHTVPLLALRKDYQILVREIQIIGRGVYVREERKGGGESQDNTISPCSMNVSWGPFNGRVSSSFLSLPCHPLSRQSERELKWGEEGALGVNWILRSMWSKTQQLGKKHQVKGHNS